MKHGRTVADSGSGLKPVLLHLVWRRYRWLYLFSLAFSLVMLFVFGMPGNPVITIILILTALPGLDAIGGPVRDQTAAFLLSRPVSRRQAYNFLLLGALGPWLILNAVLNLSVMVIPLARRPLAVASAGVPAALYLLFALWTLVFYMFSSYLGCSGWSGKSKSVQFPQFTMMLLVFALSIAGSEVWMRAGIPAATAAFAPALTVAGLALVVVFYQAGWRRFRSLDL